MLRLQLFKMRVLIGIGVLMMMAVSCSKDYVPKPKAFLRLQYPKHSYKTVQLPETNVNFQVNTLAEDVTFKRIPSTTKSYGVNVVYKPLKATVFLTYKAIEGDAQNLRAFLRDAQKLTFEHTKKADEIPAYPYEDKTRRVYGILSEVKGNVASPVQFYVTDSTRHFLTGSLYFKVKPNYDSILPAIHYVQKDMRRIMESLDWK